MALDRRTPNPRSRGQINPLLQELPQAAAQTDSTATDVATLRADFNALLAKMREAGLIGS